MKMNAKDPPGLISYIDSALPAMESVSLEEAGYFFLAMLRYAEKRTLPDFSNYARLEPIWNYVRPTIDRDIRNYHVRSLRGTWGAYKREYWRKFGKDSEPMEFEEWYLSRPDLYDEVVDAQIKKNVGDMSLALTTAAREADIYYINEETAQQKLAKWDCKKPGYRKSEHPDGDTDNAGDHTDSKGTHKEP